MTPGQPIFIIGTERSGSNLLRLILNAHSGIHVPHPPHILRFFAPIEATYGDLRQDARFLRLIDDILLLLRVHIHPWTFEPHRDAVFKKAPSRSVFGAFAALYELSLIQSGKRRWGCKSTFVIEHVPAVLSHFPRARFVHLLRDPRDVAASSTRSVFNPYHPYFTAELWKRQQRLALDLASTLPAESMLTIKYENLITKTQDTLSRLFRFLGESFEERTLHFFETDEALRSSSLSESWKNTSSPMLKNNHHKFIRELSPGQIADVEFVAGPTMLRLGYTLHSPRKTSLHHSPLSRVYHRSGMRLQDLFMRSRVEFRSILKDRNHWRRWARDSTAALLKLRRLLADGESSGHVPSGATR